MAQDWASDVKKYAPDADDGVIAGIVRYCGIALQKVDSSLVSFSDPAELARVRNNFLKKKCGLTHSDEELDAAIADVGETMKADRTKNRVTVYYLLSHRFGMHHLFVKAPKAASAKAAAPGTAGTKPRTAKAAAATAAVAAAAAAAEPPAPQAAATPKAAARKAAAPKAAAAAAPVAASDIGAAGAAAPASEAAEAPVAAPVPLMSAAPAASMTAAATDAPAAAASVAAAGVAAGAGAAGVAASALGQWKGDSSPLGRRLHLFDGGAGKEIGVLLWAALILMVAAIVWLVLFHKPAPEAAVPTTPVPAATPAAAPAAAPQALIPDGAGILTETRDEKPVIKVYFDTGKADVAPAFASEVATLKAYLDAHAGSSVGVSGYNDPSGNAAANAALSKKRAQAVKAALVAAAIPDAAIELIKPAATTDATVTATEARRVEVFIK